MGPGARRWNSKSRAFPPSLPPSGWKWRKLPFEYEIGERTIRNGVSRIVIVIDCFPFTLGKLAAGKKF